MHATRRALVTGGSGLAGSAFIDELIATGWETYAVSRQPQPEREGLTWLTVDLRDPVATTAALDGLSITHLFHSAQMAPPAPIKGSPSALRLQTRLGGLAIRATAPVPRLQDLIYGQIGKATGVADPEQHNAALLRNTLACLPLLEHVVVVTGGRHYGMHLGPTLYPGYEQPFSEADTPRAPGPNWYYDLEGVLRSGTGQWTWTVLRPSFLIGVLAGGAHNLGTALGAYIALTKIAGTPLTFIGDRRSARVCTDLTDTRQLARAGIWSTETTSAQDQAFNVATGSPFSWMELWPALGDALGRVSPIDDDGVSLARFFAAHTDLWQQTAVAHDLQNRTLADLASPAFADQMMLLDWDAEFDVSKLRAAGFDDFDTPLDVLLRTVREMERRHLIPDQRS